MKFLFIMGASGTGKTTLAKKLEEFFPDVYYRTRELSTRPIRDGEIDGFDYKFISEEDFEKLENNNDLFEAVKEQFHPYKYGGEISEIKGDKINVVIVSIEAFLSAVMRIEDYNPYDNDFVLLNIIINDETDLDVLRDNRSPLTEQKFNKGVLEPLRYYDKICFYEDEIKYKEINLSDLKEIRNDKDALNEYFKDFF